MGRTENDLNKTARDENRGERASKDKNAKKRDEEGEKKCGGGGNAECRWIQGKERDEGRERKRGCERKLWSRK